MAKDLLSLSLSDIIPPSIADDPNVKALAAAVDPELRAVSGDIRQALILSRLDELPEPVVDLLAWQFHVDFYEPTLPLPTKRQLVRDSIPWHRKKGTKWAVRRALENLGFEPTIKEWFEPDMNTAPHTFSVTGHYRDDPEHIDFLGPDTEGILMRAVMEAKPVRSWLLHLTVAPPPWDMDDHMCVWDVCTWEHGEPLPYDWGDLAFEAPPFDVEPVPGRTVHRGLFAHLAEEDVWDEAIWGEPALGAVRDENGRTVQRALFAELEWTEEAPPRRTWRGRRTWRNGGTWRRSTDRAATGICIFVEES